MPFIQYQTMLKQLFISLILLGLASSQCVHDEFIKNTTIHFYNDLQDHRMLQAPTLGPLRSFFDYSQIIQGQARDKIMVKQTMDIVGSFFYNTLQVARLSKLYYPSDKPLQCNILTIPSKYVTQGLDADIGIVVGTQNLATAPHVAKSTPCAFLQSNSRPIWGMISWNIPNFEGKYDTVGFQELVSIGLHEVTHILAFSALMYDLYPAGSPITGDIRAYLDLRINTPRINFELQKQFNCSNPSGLHLEDQDGTLISSHWEKHHVGNQFMIAGSTKNTYISPMTLALFEYTGWYTKVNYAYSQTTRWGKNKGCGFLDINNCQFDEFCSTQGAFSCTNQYKQIGRCLSDLFIGSCKMYKYYTNTICNDQNYELKNINSKLNTGERGGHYSRCFDSNYRQTGLQANILNNRCYISICTSSALYLLVKSQVLICITQGPINTTYTPAGIAGYLNCPNKIQFCSSQKNCAYNCNNNGLCTNGLCLCTGSSTLTPTCSNPDYTNDPYGSTGGRLLFEVLEEEIDLPKKSLRKVHEMLECPERFIFDPTSQKCQECSILLGCENCNANGCI